MGNRSCTVLRRKAKRYTDTVSPYLYTFNLISCNIQQYFLLQCSPVRLRHPQNYTFVPYRRLLRRLHPQQTAVLYASAAVLLLSVRWYRSHLSFRRYPSHSQGSRSIRPGRLQGQNRSYLPVHQTGTRQKSEAEQSLPWSGHSCCRIQFRSRDYALRR